MKDFLNGLLFLNFQIVTLFGKISFKQSLFDNAYRDWIPFKSIVSRINNNKSSFSIDCLDIWFSFIKAVIVLEWIWANYNRIIIPFFEIKMNITYQVHQ